MTSRRHMLGSGVLGGVASLLAGDDAEAGVAGVPQRAEQSLDGVERAIRSIHDDMERATRAIESLRDTVREDQSFTDLRPIRSAQKTYLRERGKVPDFIDVGTDIWFNVYDWHIRWQQPMAFGRDAAGRYTIMVFQTTIIMRAELAPNYVGDPYDRPQA